MEKRAEVKEREERLLRDIYTRLENLDPTVYYLELEADLDPLEKGLVVQTRNVIKIFLATRNIRAAQNHMEIITGLANFDKERPINETIKKAVSQASGIFHNIGYRESCKKI